MMYYIQVRHSGLWVGCEDNANPDQHVKLAQVEEKDRQLFYVSPVGKRLKYDDRVELWDEVDPKKWMENLSDKMRLSSVNMPGTHDSGTQYVTIGDLGAKCQDESILEQLNMGVRFFDIRLQKEDGRNYYNLCHADFDCHYDENQDIPLAFEKHVLEEWIYPFLEENPSETIVLCIKEDEGETDNKNKDMGTMLQNIIDKNDSRWYRRNEDPLLKDVRGRIVLVSRLKHPVEGYSGIDFSDWESRGMYREFMIMY